MKDDLHPWFTCDHDDSDAGLPTHPHGSQDLLPGRVQHAHAPHEGQVRLGGWGRVGQGEEPEEKSAVCQQTHRHLCRAGAGVAGHLVGGEATRLLQVEAGDVGRRVPRGHGEAAQRVPPRTPLPHRGQQLLPQRRTQWHAGRAAEPDVVAALQHALRCPLVVVVVWEGGGTW